MKKVSFVQDGALVVAPASYGVVDFSIGGQLARKMVPDADGRTSRGMVAINNMRDRITACAKEHVRQPFTLFRVVMG